MTFNNGNHSETGRIGSIASLAERALDQWGSPLWLYFPGEVRSSFQRFREGLRSWGSNAFMAYSVKTNSFYGLLGELKALGAWAEVVSLWEYEIALKAGFPSSRIVMNGPHKPPHEIKSIATRPPALINLDSMEELRQLERIASKLKATFSVGLRFTPPKTGETWSRFGLHYQSREFTIAVARIRKNPFLRLACIQFHLGTQVTDAARYRQAVSVAREIWHKYELDSSVILDIGGGYDYKHDALANEQPLDLPTLFAELREVWGGDDAPPLVAEPGRIIAAPAFALVTRVLAAKARMGEPTIIVLDGGTNQNVMGAFYEHRWVFTRPGPVGDFRLCGPLCMEDDILSGPRFGPVPTTGSTAIMFNAGAYSISLSRTFIQPRPPIVRVDGQRSLVMMVPREELANAYALHGPVKAAKQGVRKILGR